VRGGSPGGIYHSVVFVFGLYTVIVWWLAFRHRRRWRGILFVVLGSGGLFLLSQAVDRLFPTPEGRGSPILQVLLIPYEILLFIGGLYIVWLPRRHSVMTCEACGYDMRGLDDGARCPECGRDDAAVRPPGPRRASPADEPEDDAERKDPGGNPEDEKPRDPPPLRR
jgi:hypothetical protein